MSIAALTLVLNGCGQKAGAPNLAVPAPKPIEPAEKYIVVLKEPSLKAAVQKAAGPGGKKGEVDAHALVTQMMRDLSLSHQIQVQEVFSAALRGGVVLATGAQVAALRKDASVDYVEKDQVVRLGQAQTSAVQTNATWGLDRLDQANLPLNQTYSYADDASGDGVNAYVIDTGVLTSHSEFQGRVGSGADVVDSDSDPTDCNGHGTHVAGTIGGRLYGVAKKVRIFGVRVLDCQGSGTYAGVISGIEWVTRNHVKPAVANMSLGGPVSQAVDDAVKASVGAGVTYVVAAGNENTDACQSSPARAAPAITVGATTRFDERASFSNVGPCVDIFAPGAQITSAWFVNPSATNTISGTSMASPHVAGVVAQYLSKFPQSSPQEVAGALKAGALTGRLSGLSANSPNLLLNNVFLNNSGGGGGGGSEVELRSGISVTGLRGASASERRYLIRVPVGSRLLTVSLFGGAGDADLYVRGLSRPTLSAYDCRPYLNGNSEECRLSGLRAGDYYILVHGYSSYSGASLRATVR